MIARARLDGGNQDLLQIDAVDDAIGKAVALAEAFRRDRDDQLAADRIAHVDRDRLRGGLRDRRVEPEAGKDTPGIGSQLNARAELAQLLGSFSDQRPEAAGGEGECRRQPADPGAGDDDRLPLAHSKVSPPQAAARSSP